MLDMIKELEAQRDRLQSAIDALNGVTGGASKRGTGSRQGRKKLSAAARARISRAMKQRWAERKKKVIRLAKGA